MRIFLIPLPITFLCPEKGLGFFFSKKNSLNWGVKCMKFKPAPENRGEFIRVSFENCT